MEWKWIDGYKDLYKIYKDGRVFSERSDKFLKPCKKSGKGYLYVNLTVNGNQKLFYIHRLIAISFIANPSDKPQINHIDGNILNNDLSNLEWCTQSENNEHAIENGLIENFKGGKHANHAHGENHGKTTLKSNDVMQIRSIYSQGFATQQEIANAYSISRGTVSDIVRGKTWIYI